MNSSKYTRNKSRQASLEDFPLAQIIGGLEEKPDFTGWIRIKRSKAKNSYKIYFIDGSFVGTVSTKKILKILQDHAILSDTKANLILDQYKKGEYKKPLGEVLTQVYSIPKEQVHRIFERQLDELREAFGWREGEVGLIDLKKYKGQIPWLELTGEKMDVPELLCQIVENTRHERYNYDMPEKNLCLLSTHKNIENYAFARQYKEVFAYCDRNINIQKIAKLTGKEITEVRIIAYTLEILGIVKTEFATDTAIEYADRKLKKINSKINLKDSLDWKTPIIAISLLNLAFIFLTSFGMLQNTELSILDRFFKFKGTQKNNNVTLVTVSDEDISQLQQYPISDRVLAKAIENISRYNPYAIGVDIYRDIPVNPGHEELKSVYQKTDSLIGVEKITKPRVNPPPYLAQLGAVAFSDLQEDNDGIMRRALISLQDETGTTRMGLGSFLALIRAYKQNMDFTQIDKDTYQFGKSTIKSLTNKSGGYWKEDIQGLQILLNYRHKAEDFEQIGIIDAINDRLNPKSIKNKVIIIGINAASLKDYIYTPYSRNNQGRVVPMYGSVVHANIASAAIDISDGKPVQLQIHSKLWEIRYIVLWSLIGFGAGAISLNIDRIFIIDKLALNIIQCSLLLVACFGTAWIYFAYQGWWIPLVAPSLNAITAAIITNLRYKSNIEGLIYLDKAGVFNRRYFNKNIKSNLSAAVNQSQSIGLILLEIKPKRDIEEKIYDNYLKLVAKTIKPIVEDLNSDGFIARYELDTLAIVLNDTNTTKMNRLIKVIKPALSKQYKLSSLIFRFGGSLSDPQHEVLNELQLTTKANHHLENGVNTSLNITSSLG